MPSYNLNTVSVELFRSYPARANASPNCPIWQALAATTAHREFFEDVAITVGLTPVKYVGTEYGKNNPTDQIAAEAKKVFGRHRQISSLHSIGAGIPSVIALPSSMSASTLKTLEAICRDCEQMADEMNKRYQEEKTDTGINPYTRLNVEQGMQGLTLRDFDLPQALQVHTWSYLRGSKVTARVDKALLKAEPRVREIIKAEQRR